MVAKLLHDFKKQRKNIQRTIDETNSNQVATEEMDEDFIETTADIEAAILLNSSMVRVITSKDFRLRTKAEFPRNLMPIVF